MSSGSKCFFSSKEGMFFSIPKLPYLWRAEHWCVYLKSSWLWNIGVFIGVSMCEECSHLRHICESVCVCVCFSVNFCCNGWQCVTVPCNLLCWWAQEEATGLEVNSLLLFGPQKHLIYSRLYFSWHFLDLFISIDYLFPIEIIFSSDLCGVQSSDRHVSLMLKSRGWEPSSSSHVCVCLCVHISLTV